MEGFNSAAYWDARYRDGGTSGAGSRGRLAKYKAWFINQFVSRNAVHSVIELGCGDGEQLELLEFESYLGIDVSPKALDLCMSRFGTSAGFKFLLASDLASANECELGLSLDVLYHLIEDRSFEDYLRNLFLLSIRYVIIYSSDSERPPPAPHVRHRPVSTFIAQRFPEWRLAARVPNRFLFDSSAPEETSFCDFLIYVRMNSTDHAVIAV